MLSAFLAAATLSASPPPAAASGRDPRAQVCHSEPIQGSRIPHRVCLTAAEAAQLQRDARSLLEHAQAGSQAPNMATLVQMRPVR